MIPLPINYTEMEDIYVKTFGSSMRTLAIAAARDGEGVSTLAYALARRAAAMGRRTLLVDFNRRDPSVGRRLGLPPVKWSPSTETAQENVIPLSNTGLDVLTAPMNDVEWLREREAEILQACFSRWLVHYDCVVADTSPLTIRNQENFPPENVCAACDGVLLSVLTGGTSETRVAEAITRLRSVGACITGTVLNDRRAPSLADELVRETFRFEKKLPKMMESIRQQIRRSVFLNQAI